MATACLFIAYDRPVSGREAEAFKVLESSLSTIEGFKKEGWFESYEVIGLTPHSGSVNGFLLLKGERAKLDELRRTDAFERVSMKLGHVLQGYGVVPGVTLEGLLKVKERNRDLFE
jgi:predicted AAA+ superfamily ATPase